MKRKAVKGFTLIELLVVIGIIAILSALVLLAINPAEIQRKSRDTTRFSDLTTIRKAIDFTIADNGGPLQANFTADSSGNRTANGTSNYIGMDVSKFIPILPDDPQHLAGSTVNVTISDGVTQVSRDNMRYYFASNGKTYELNAYLESSDNNSKVLNTGDGGDSNIRYEIGTAPSLNLILGP